MISFVILHYKNIKDTLECMESIVGQVTDKSHSIVVVDNGTSTIEDRNKIEKYTKDIIVNQENLGFAKANNIGSIYAIEKYKPDFLVVINNDTVLEDPHFIDKVYAIYEKKSFDALGPKIITDDGDSVNPFRAYETKEEVREAIQKSEKFVKIYKNVLLRTCLSLYRKVKYTCIKPKHLQNGSAFKEDISLHGCAIIFAKQYYQKYKDVFYNETFLYHEEEFLTYRRKKDHLVFIYDPELTIFHKEGASLSYHFGKKQYEKLIFREKEIQKSLRLLLEIMEEDKNI